MRFLKTKPGRQSAEDSAAAVRLKAVTGRGAAERGAYPQIRLPEQAAERPPAPPRLFWTPDEVQPA